jgi:hypothetical protein
MAEQRVGRGGRAGCQGEGCNLERRIALIVAYMLRLQQTHCNWFHLDYIITYPNRLQQILSYLGLHVDSDQRNARLYSNSNYSLLLNE